MRFGGGSTVQIKGRGTELFQFEGGEQRLLTEVYYIPALSSNIISIGQLTKGGSKVVIASAFLRLYDSQGRLLMKVKRSSNRLYKVLMKTCEPVCLYANISDPAWLWHTRLGHVYFQALKMMVNRGMVYGLPKISHPMQVCTGCTIAIQPRLPFPTVATYQAKERLELVLADLCGPITPQTAAGNKYFLLFVSDYSRMMWVYISSQRVIH